MSMGTSPEGVTATQVYSPVSPPPASSCTGCISYMFITAKAEESVESPSWVRLTSASQ